MSYEVILDPHASRQLAKLSPQQRQRIYPALLRLESNPRPPGVKKLVSDEAWRIRVGDYRALYVVDDKARTVTVYDIDLRARIYRNGAR